jgi:ribosome-associated protein
MIQDGEVKYNGKIELQRGKKVYPGDTFEAAGKQFVVVK